MWVLFDCWCCVSLPHTALPCAQQQTQHRERLETFDDVIRSSLEVTGKSGNRVCDGPGLVCKNTDVPTVVPSGMFVYVDCSIRW